MCKFIGIEDLAANALIELMRAQKDHHQQPRVSFEHLINYGNCIVRLLMDQGEEAILLLSRSYTDAAIRNYSDYFSIERDSSNMEYFVLKAGKSLTDLQTRFRASLPVTLLLAFTNRISVQELMEISA